MKPTVDREADRRIAEAEAVARAATTVLRSERMSESEFGPGASGILLGPSCYHHCVTHVQWIELDSDWNRMNFALTHSKPGSLRLPVACCLGHCAALSEACHYYSYAAYPQWPAAMEKVWAIAGIPSIRRLLGTGAWKSLGAINVLSCHMFATCLPQPQTIAVGPLAL